MFEILPKLRALDGHREGVPVIEPVEIDVGGSENVEYKCNEDWFTPEIFMSNPGKNLFVTSGETTKDE